MGDLIQVLLLVICGIVLFWIGYYLFFGPMSPVYPYLPWSKNKKIPYSNKGKPGDPMVCPVCSTRMLRGELVKTTAFATGVRSKDRLVYIKGCRICLEGTVPRRCPICKHKMKIKDYLVSRMFDRPQKKNHIHVLGCNHCKKV